MVRATPGQLVSALCSYRARMKNCTALSAALRVSSLLLPRKVWSEPGAVRRRKCQCRRVRALSCFLREENQMAMLGRLIGLAKSPQGRKLLNQAQKAARDPQNRERLQEVRSRFGKGKTAPAQNSQPNTQRVQSKGEGTPGRGGGGSVGGEPEGRSSAGAAGGGTGEEESRRSNPS